MLLITAVGARHTLRTLMRQLRPARRLTFFNIVTPQARRDSKIVKNETIFLTLKVFHYLTCKQELPLSIASTANTGYRPEVSPV